MPRLRISLGVILILALGLYLFRQVNFGVIEAYNSKNLVQLQIVTTDEDSPPVRKGRLGGKPSFSRLGQIYLTDSYLPQ